MRPKKPEHPAVVIFRKRAKSIYAGMKKRAKKDRVVLPFDFADFCNWLLKSFVSEDGAANCAYSNEFIYAENFFVDHDWPISRRGAWNLGNLLLCTEKENLCKGNMTGEEWRGLRSYIFGMPQEVSESIMRRLAVGDVQRFAHFRRQRKAR